MKQTAERLHAARIDVKKLRYVLELVEASGDKGAGGARKRVKVLKGIQQLLGDHHDVHVVEEMLAEEVAQRKVKGLAAAWRKWQREKERGQAERAAEFFAKSYAWMNERDKASSGGGS
jgi:CHAD domain-containing protein